MRTTIDLPDPLLKHLKARAALEGRTLRDVVVQLVEQGLNAPPQAATGARVQARPVVGAVGAVGRVDVGGEVPNPVAAQSPGFYTNAQLFELVHGNG